MKYAKLNPNDACLLNSVSKKLCSLSTILSPNKLSRIKDALDYSRVFTYDPVGDENVIQVVHSGTTENGLETVTETITYVDPTVNGSQVVSIIYS